MLIITGGAGFIGSNFVLQWCANSPMPVLNLDLLTYAGNMDNLTSLQGNSCHIFIQGDICDAELLDRLFTDHRPRAVIHFAAESHVDRSIHGPEIFVQTNVLGTMRLLDAALSYWQSLSGSDREAFRFLHVSTDEVFGTLGPNDPPFCETTPYAPNSPYAASKAGSDHLVRAFHHTYGLSVLTSNCSNNYSPYQFPEKLIPLMIVNCLAGKPLPSCGDGQQIRDWLYVDDHCTAIRRVLEAGTPGETYYIGGWNEKANLEIVHLICSLLDELAPAQERGVLNVQTNQPVTRYAELITHVADRPGHDLRYAIDASKIERELGWRPAEAFETGIRKTVQWYLANLEWVGRREWGVVSGE